MFEAAELGHSLTKEAYDERLPQLREALLDAQYALLEQKKCSVVVLVGGVDGGGRGEAVNRLLEWLDPRHVEVHALTDAQGEDAERPSFYRFWKVLPPRGRAAVFVGSWYSKPILDRVYGRTRPGEIDHSLRQMVLFERMLASEGVLVLKFWLHLSKRAQRQRFIELEKSKKTAWRVTPTDWEHHARYDKFRKVCERALRTTSTAEAPWCVIEAVDPRYRDVSIGTAIESAIRRRLEQPAPAALVHAPPLPAPIDGKRILSALPPAPMAPPDAKDRIAQLQGELATLFRDGTMRRRSAVLVFEGMDAAGKGGSIRRVAAALDARSYKVVPIAAPTDEERARPYLWRFWRKLPGHGQMTLFDRSWYGRVLVERVEGYCDTDDWMRAYGEINDFEEQLAEGGATVVKLWLQISPEEQLRRFEERQNTGFKRFKLGPEDWRNREKWPRYEEAASEMIERTSTEFAPWTVVQADDKQAARLRVLETVVARLRG
jgi:polyphosphate:AMP phosphotransferase